MIERRFITVDGRLVHYRRAGSGPPFVLLHGMPLSSRVLVPLIERHAAGQTVIALDLPGYGSSDPLPIERPSIADYAAALGKTLDAFGCERVDLYGQNTGSMISVDFANTSPDRVRSLVLENVPVFTPAERADNRLHYTPSIEAEPSGAHLIRAWAMRRDGAIFFPWYRPVPANRLSQDLPPPNALFDEFLDVMRAGTGYWKGFQAVFNFDGAAALSRLTVPATVVSGTYASLRGHLARIQNAPANLRVSTPADWATNDALISSFLADPAHGPLPPETPPAPAEPSSENDVVPGYVRTSAGYLFYRRYGPSGRRPLILHHASPGAGAGLLPLLRLLGRDRPVVVFDTPGNGDSAAAPGEPEMPDTAKLVVEAINALRIDDFDSYGALTGAQVALEVALAAPDRVRHLILDSFPFFRLEDAAHMLEEHAPAMPLSSDGSHLIWAWNIVRDRYLWQPWNNRTVAGAAVPRVQAPLPDASTLHDRVVEFLKGARTYHVSYRAVFRLAVAERLPLLRCPTLFLAGESSSFQRSTQRALSLVPGAATAAVPGPGAFAAHPDAAGIIAGFLEDG